jgi:hypothetical protein
VIILKEKIKEIIFTIAILYSIVIVILMIYSYNTSINTMPFTDESDNITTLNKYKEDLKNIEESSCKTALNNLINHYERTSYNGIVNLKDKYLDEDGVLKYAEAIFKDCSLKDDIRQKIAIKTISSSIQIDEVLKELYFQYEIRVPDLNNRSIMEMNFNTIRYKINRENQLEVIEILVDMLKGEQEYE